MRGSDRRWEGRVCGREGCGRVGSDTTKKPAEGDETRAWTCREYSVELWCTTRSLWSSLWLIHPYLDSQPPSHSLHPHSHSSTLRLTPPPSHSLLHPHTHSSTLTLTLPLPHSLLNSLIHSSTLSLTPPPPPLFHSHTHSSTLSFTPPPSHSLHPHPTLPLPHSLFHLHTPHSPDQLQSAGREVFLKLVLVQLLHTRPQHASRAAMYDLQWTDTPFWTDYVYTMYITIQWCHIYTIHYT